MPGFPRAAMSRGDRSGPPPMGARWRTTPTYAESLYPELELGWAPLHAWRTRGIKYIKAPHPELYDLEKDVSETTNRAGERAARR